MDEGYNSADEGSGNGKATSPENEKAFEEDLKKMGFNLVRMRGDGNCLFRAVGKQSDALLIRELTRLQPIRCMAIKKCTMKSANAV